MNWKFVDVVIELANAFYVVAYGFKLFGHVKKTSLNYFKEPFLMQRKSMELSIGGVQIFLDYFEHLN